MYLMVCQNDDAISLSHNIESSTHRSTRGKSCVISSNRLVYPSLDAWKSWGARRYLYLPHSVINVVASRASGDKSTLWYPFHASRTVFLFPGGITLTMLNGDGVWWVSRLVAVFRFWRSIVRLGVPSFLGMAIILKHQVVEVHVGTCSIIRNAISTSNCFLTASFQWCGIGIGLWTAIGVWSDRNEILRGSPVMVCSCWWGQVLKALFSKCRLIHSSRSCWYSGVANSGILVGMGDGDRSGQPHEAMVVSVSRFWSPCVDIVAVTVLS